ncbi:hypothetical protein PG997_005165 [Apiospora hydei]|uniref:Uncharacterized protein n=1 Tax=Apiospora hydei TaxID=1337664 RepID=A0ABR1X462_9PEZI
MAVTGPCGLVDVVLGAVVAVLDTDSFSLSGCIVGVASPLLEALGVDAVGAVAVAEGGAGVEAWDCDWDGGSVIAGVCDAEVEGGSTARGGLAFGLNLDSPDFFFSMELILLEVQSDVAGSGCRETGRKWVVEVIGDVT